MLHNAMKRCGRKQRTTCLCKTGRFTHRSCSGKAELHSLCAGFLYTVIQVSAAVSLGE